MEGGGQWELVGSGRGGCWGWVGNHPLVQRQSHCVFSEAKKQAQCTCQARTVIGSSLTPHAALLMHSNGTIHPVVDCHEFTRSEKCCL